jgi:hypothetical protein
MICLHFDMGNEMQVCTKNVCGLQNFVYCYCEINLGSILSYLGKGYNFIFQELRYS